MWEIQTGAFELNADGIKKLGTPGRPLPSHLLPLKSGKNPTCRARTEPLSHEGTACSAFHGGFLWLCTPPRKETKASGEESVLWGLPRGVGFFGFDSSGEGGQAVAREPQARRQRWRGSSCWQPAHGPPPPGRAGQGRAALLGLWGWQVGVFSRGLLFCHRLRYFHPPPHPPRKLRGAAEGGRDTLAICLYQTEPHGVSQRHSPW